MRSATGAASMNGRLITDSERKSCFNNYSKNNYEKKTSSINDS